MRSDLAARSGDLRAASAPRRRSRLAGVELLRRSLDRAAARGRPRAAGGAAVHVRRRRRRRPVDVLQVPSRRPVRALRRRCHRAAMSGDRSSTTSTSSWPSDGRRSSRSTPSTCPTPRAPPIAPSTSRRSIGIQALDAARAARLLPQRRLLRARRRGLRAGLSSRATPDRSRISAAVRGGREAVGRARRSRGRALVDASLDLLARVTSRDGRSVNPFRRYADRFSADLDSRCRPPRAVSSATRSRRCGSAARRSSSAARISAGSQANGEHGLERIAAACDVIATTAKALQFKTARAVNTQSALRLRADARHDGRRLGRDDGRLSTARYGALAHHG